jgi:two-component system cell cycle response regulator
MDEKCVTHVCGPVTASAAFEPVSPVEARPMYLIVVGGGTPGALLRLDPGGSSLGRSHENTVRFNDAGVSRRHASIVADSQGGVWLTDLGSTNGTFLNGTRVTAYAPHRLHDGDRLQLGSSVVVKFVRLDACDEQFQRELFERSVRDPLTGLYNRAFFLDQIGPLAELSVAKGLGLAVLMLDVDHFKRINDAFGHDVGDAVLREVAVVLRESTRAEDLVARYGGEEFVIALPVVAPDQATERAERLRSNLAVRRLAVPSGAGPLRVTASLGLAFAHPGRLRTPSVLISAADQCLYQAKDSGRNQVVIRVDPSQCGKRRDLVTPHSGEA